LGKRTGLLLTGAATIVLLGAAGCGGGGADSSTTAAATKTATATTAVTISKAVFIKRADAVCEKADKQTEREFAAYAKENQIPTGKEPSPAQYAAIAKTIVVPALHRQADEIEALGTPAKDGGRIERFLAAVRAAIEKAEEEPTAAAQSPRKLLTGADKVVAGYGFKVCG
jgi:hypothetical protein